MGKNKSSKIIQSKTSPKKEPLGGGTKFGIFVCIFIVAALAFAASERLGITGTHFLFKGEIELRESDSPESGGNATSASGAGSETKSSAESESKRSRLSDDSGSRSDSEKKSQSASDKKKSSRKKSSAAKTKAPVEPLPLHAFIDISRKPHTWPGFIRLTRSRTISMTDPRTGESMGRMEIPKGTVVKVFNVLPTGTLEVFDRTGQKFRVEASGTNFAAAFAAVKNKPKKKAKPKKSVAKTPEKTSAAPKPEPAVAAAPKKEKSGSAPVMSAFGVVFDEGEEWGDDADDE